MSAIQTLEEGRQQQSTGETARLPVSVIVATRNEGRNLPRCLASLDRFGEVYVIDSNSVDETSEIARSFGAEVVQFHYHGGWPKKRQWAMETLPLKYEWIFLVDADESVTAELAEEIKRAIERPGIDGCYIALKMHFLGRVLQHGDASFFKLSLFRRGKGRFECRFADQDLSMCDMEVHEHIVVEGRTAKLKHPLLHRNVDSLSRYIEKHNEYSNWESRVLLNSDKTRGALPAILAGTQAQRRRWLKQKFFKLPGSPALLFFYRYVFRLGFLDGISGLIYCGFQAVQMFHTKAKIHELRAERTKASNVRH
jgi:glycosyltransferase involved in cell wall biosynthesis